MSYCYGLCEHLNEKKHKCELTGEKLSYIKMSGILAHEHVGTCQVEEKQYERCKGCDFKDSFGKCTKTKYNDLITCVTDDKCYKLQNGLNENCGGVDKYE